MLLHYIIIAKLFNHIAADVPIRQVVHLMLENRAFDAVLGYINHNPEIDNLVGNSARGKRFCNLKDDNDPNSKEFCHAPVLKLNGTFSPNHLNWQSIRQVYGTYNPSPEIIAQPAPMTGFASEATRSRYYTSDDDSQQVMSGFAPKDIPIHAQLAKEYMVCDRWFSSVPGSTQPNRLFLHTGTSTGNADNNREFLMKGSPNRTLFEDLRDGGKTWKSYFGELPALYFLGRIRRKMLMRTRGLGKFFHAARRGNLASYSFLEPIYGETALGKGMSSDGHPSPGETFTRAEKLLKDVYEAVRNSPQWESTLLLVTYDEHGGYFDHVPPPANVPNPDGLIDYNANKTAVDFDFTRLGVRVPALFISPWIAKGSGIHTLTQLFMSQMGRSQTANLIIPQLQPRLGLFSSSSHRH